MYRVFSLKNNLTYGPIIGGQVIPEDTETINTISSDVKQTYKGDVFQLHSEADKETNTTLEKNDLLKKFVGLNIVSKGFITDVFTPYERNIDGQRKLFYTVVIEKNEKHDYDYSFIFCEFDNTWGQKLETINIPYEVKFTGKIEKLRPGVVFLQDCKMIK